MSKTVKNLLIALTLVCAIVFVIFCIELFLLNRETGDDDDGAPLSGDSIDGDGNQSNGGAAGTDRQGAGNTGVNAGQNAGSNPADGTRPAPTGRRYGLLMPDEMLLVLHADEELIEHVEMHDSDMFNYTGSGTASLEIIFDLIPTGGAGQLASRLLDNYVGGSAMASAERAIGSSTLRGFHASGVKDGVTYEVWTHSLAAYGTDDLAVAFIMNYSNEDQKNVFDAILDSLEMIQG